MTLTEQEALEQFTQLFRGRGDAQGTWEGGCLRQPLTPASFDKHLRNGPHIGVYPLITDKVSWGCIDIDGKDHPTEQPGMWDWDRMHTIALRLVQVLAVKGIHAYTERTRNGIHVWVFPEDGLVPAWMMRRSLMAACKAIGYNPKEVNPKQEQVDPSQLGNYVRLPYPGALTQPLWLPEERCFYSPDNKWVPWSLGTFLASVKLTATEALEQTAALWTPPVLHSEVNTQAGLNIESLLPLLKGDTFTIWRDGPLDGSDRSTTLARLAHKLAGEGFKPDAAFQIVKSADQRWGKHHLRPETWEQNILKLIELAYGT
jgi:hypothetical protein